VEWMYGARGGGAELRVGQTVRETTRLISSEGKRTMGGEEMVVVGVEKEYEILDGRVEGKTALVDRRYVCSNGRRVFVISIHGRLN